MKRLLIVLMILAFAVPVFSQDGMGSMKGRMLVGGFVDYGLGFGDAFKDFEETEDGVTVKVEHSLGLSFGGCFFYGIAPKIAVGAIVDYQTQKMEGTVSGEIPDGFPTELFVFDESESWIVISPNLLYVFTPEKKLAPFVQAGPGYYMSSVEGADAEIGVNAGLGFGYMVSPKLAIVAGVRGHMVFTPEESTTYIDIHAGISLPLGGGSGQ